MTSSSLLQLPIPLSPPGAWPSRSLHSEVQGRARRHSTCPSPLPASPCLSWLGAPLGPQNLPSCTDPGSQGSGGPPPSLGLQVRGAYLGLGLGLVETLDAVTEVDVLFEPTVGTDQRAAPTCPHSLFVPGPLDTPGTPRTHPSHQVPSWGGRCLHSCLLPSGATLGYCKEGAPTSAAPHPRPTPNWRGWVLALKTRNLLPSPLGPQCPTQGLSRDLLD